MTADEEPRRTASTTCCTASITSFGSMVWMSCTLLVMWKPRQITKTGSPVLQNTISRLSASQTHPTVLPSRR